MDTNPEIIRLLERSNQLVEMILRVSLRPVVEAEFTDPKAKALYDLTDTKTARSEIAKRLKMSSKTISQYWQRWETLGLLTKDGKSYRKVL